MDWDTLPTAMHNMRYTSNELDVVGLFPRMPYKGTQAIVYFYENPLPKWVFVVKLTQDHPLFPHDDIRNYPGVHYTMHHVIKRVGVRLSINEPLCQLNGLKEWTGW